MAKTPDRVRKFLDDLTPAATAKAREEAADIQALIDKQRGGFMLQPFDWNFYSEQVRKAKYDVEDSEIKPYFELNKVLQDGVFYAAHELYGLNFRERHDLPVYNPDVRVFEVFQEDGSHLALFYCDYFKRDNKNGGAWMDTLVGQSKLLNTQPVVYNVANFTKPAPGQPALISFDDVTTMFHEFGHALHGMFANQKYPSLSGTAVARDYVEFPSQFNEHWALDPRVLAHYAVHYQTGKPMPAELVAKIKKAKTFNQGYAVTEVLAAAALDMQWHTLSANAVVDDADKFEAEALKKPPPPFDTGLPLRAIAARQAIAHCAAEIELTPAQFIETAIRLQERPDLAHEVLGQMATAIRQLTPWFEKFIELYELEINRDSARNEIAPATEDVPLATPPEAEPAVPPKRRGRPVGSRNKQPSEKKSTLPLTAAERSRNYRARRKSKASQSNTDNLGAVLLDRPADNGPQP